MPDGAREPVLPAQALWALAVVPPFIALLLDPDPHMLADTARQAARSLAVIWVFTMFNGTLTHRSINAALSRAHAAQLGLAGRAALTITVILATAALSAIMLHPLWIALDPRIPPPATFFVRTALLSAVYVGVALVVQRFRTLERDARLAAVQSQHREGLARLAALQARTNPHFLFNSLGTVLELLDRSADEAEHTLERLTTLYRYALAASEQPLARATDELDVARAYLAVAQTRFGARLSVEWSIDTAIERKTLPSMSMQPIIENAVTHGVAMREKSTTIRVEALVRDRFVEVRVSNELPVARRASHGSGTSMRDLRERLALLYGAHASLTLERNDAGMFHTVLRVPHEQAS